MGKSKRSHDSSSEDQLEKKHKTSTKPHSKHKKKKTKRKRERSSSSDESYQSSKKKMKKKKKKEKREKKNEDDDDDDEEMDLVGPAPPPGLAKPEKRVQTPMTKEDWEKKQSVLRKVYDEESGRHRLIRGDGEVVEEIVSKDRHKEINKQATLTDGQYFQSVLSNKKL